MKKLLVCLGLIGLLFIYSCGTKSYFKGIRDLDFEIGETMSFISGVEAFDSDGSKTTFRVDTSKVNFQEEGVYEIRYYFTDKSGKLVEEFASVFLHYKIDVFYSFDDLQIAISEVPDFSEGLEISGTYTTFEVDDSKLDITKKGTYVVTYSIYYYSLLVATFERTVIVSADTTAPVLLTNRLTIITGTNPDTISDLLDYRDDSTKKEDILVQITYTVFDYNTPGDYSITISLTDISGNSSTYVIICVVTNGSSPRINISEDIYTPVGSSLNFLNLVYAIDFEDGDLISSLIIESDEVNYEVEGIYNVYFTLTDSHANFTEKIVHVHVTPPATEIDILYLNDLHGDVLGNLSYSSAGISKIGNYIEETRKNNPYTLFLSGGDMFQGTLISNYFNGAPVVEALNYLGLDSFTLGNHEFDWGLKETMVPIFTGNSSYVNTNYRMLAANLVYKGTDIMPSFVYPYEIKEVAGFTIGIIGLLGENIESAIATKRVEDYEFTSELEAIKKYSKYLRESEGCDFIIVDTHNDNSFIIRDISHLPANERVDLVFNGHTHQSYVNTYTNSSNGEKLYQIQSASYGLALGQVKLSISGKTITDIEAYNIPSYDLQTESTNINNIIAPYVEQVYELMNTTILVAGEYLSRNNLADFIALLMRKATGVVIAWHNYGGTRVDIQEGVPITVGKIYEVFPFDNVIVTGKMRGDFIKQIYSYNNYSASVDINSLENSREYTIASNDFIYYGDDFYDLTSGTENNTQVLIRDILIAELILKKNFGYPNFKFSNTVFTTPSILDVSYRTINSYNYINI
ncbi:MAG: 5'-nucleotidase C-terminal domain-containing protein [Acholeplasmatales bacterium]|jgi:2',3'-cyclic-nucleotide 2'-phosphodiesterase (5'-nucleotidase family)|nr:5'-nucleotidase C-terminal domain-containing protein [Acholeplasmatales bacterium]